MAKIPQNPVVLIDGSSYLFRAYYALPPLTNSKGDPTGAIYGVINMLKNLLKAYKPSHIAVVFDTKEKNFRHKIFPEYKANRTEMPEDLIPQIEPLHQVIKAMGLPLIAISGIEADDVIGVLAKQIEQDNKFTLISTGDKDMAQLVNSNTILINTMNNQLLDIDGVVAKFGIPPEQIIDYLSLIGDTVDNIPGVPKVGPKTAVKWLQQFGNLDNIVENADKITGKVGENLRSSLEDLALYKRLTTIDTSLDLKLSLADLKRNSPNIEELSNMFAELEFKTWQKDLKNNQQNFITPLDYLEQDSKTAQDIKVADKNQTDNSELQPEHNKNSNLSLVGLTSINSDKKYQTVIVDNELDALVTSLQQAKIFAFDTETDSLDAISANLIGMSFAITPDEAFYIPLKHNYQDAPKQLDFAKVISKIKPVLENNKISKVGHNFKYDMEVLAKYNIVIQGEIHDTMLQSYVLNSVAGRHDMATCANRELQLEVISYEDIAGKGKKQLTFNEIDIETASLYAAEDADVTLKLHLAMFPKVCAVEKLKQVYTTIEMPLVKVLQHMEQNGVFIKAKLLDQQSKDIAQKLQGLANEIESMAGESFNINSPKQLQAILFDKLGLPVLQKTPTGQASTAENVLQDLSLEYELPKYILEYRSLNKLKNTYTDKLPEKINPSTGRVHTSYHQAVTATGRLSSTDPNLQNIPIRTEEGRKIRSAFLAEPSNRLLAADYSQIELRIMAHLSNDKSLINTFKKGEDVHRATAAEVWSIPLGEVSKEQRRNAKAINFGLIYGMSAFGLAKQLGIDKKDAQTYIDSYFNKFPGVLAYMEQTREFARKHGYVETMFGRRLYLPDINARNYPRRLAAERAAINAPMQGAQADIIKLAMIKLNTWIQDNNYSIKMIMQVHDELVFEIADREADSSTSKGHQSIDKTVVAGKAKGSIDSLLALAINEIPKIMTSVVDLQVPLLVEVGVGNNWEDAH